MNPYDPWFVDMRSEFHRLNKQNHRRSVAFLSPPGKWGGGGGIKGRFAVIFIHQPAAVPLPPATICRQFTGMQITVQEDNEYLINESTFK